MYGMVWYGMVRQQNALVLQFDVMWYFRNHFRLFFSLSLHACRVGTLCDKTDLHSEDGGIEEENASAIFPSLKDFQQLSIPRQPVNPTGHSTR